MYAKHDMGAKLRRGCVRVVGGYVWVCMWETTIQRVGLEKQKKSTSRRNGNTGTEERRARQE